ncbi:hypothetical protein FQA39_LY02462 [Lamprigera yunnana]|nr:hypothetical protein FQA39_LY02462 [Lamprigera yunnana]
MLKRTETKKGCWCKHRTKLEWYLLSILGLAGLTSVCVIISVIKFSQSLSTCSTLSCVKAANEILNYIEQDIDPCENFYEFACNKFLNNVHLKEEPTINVESIMRDNYATRMKVIIQEPILHLDSPSMVMAKQMYATCIKETSKENSMQYIRDSLTKIGGWAVLEGNDWNEQYFDWMVATYKLRQLGFPHQYFVKMAVHESNENASKYLLKLASPWAFISVTTPKEEDMLYNYMVDIAVAFGADRSLAESEYRDVTYNETWDEDINQDYFILSNLQIEFPGIPWLEFIEHMLSPVPNIQLEDVVFVNDIPYIYYLHGVLNKTSKRVLSNYIAWRMIIEYTSILSDDASKATEAYYTRANNDKIISIPTIPQICSEIAHNSFSLPIQAEYVHRFVSKEAREDVTLMIENMIDIFKDEVDDLDWMDYDTRRLALERLSNISIYVAYPDELLDNKNLEETYKRYKINEDNLLASLLSIKFEKTNDEFEKLHEAEDEDDAISRKYTTYGMVYYLASDNSITVPHRILQSVIYDEDRPKYLNYGGLGSFIAHQLLHALFEGSSIRQESQYYDWMSPATQKIYQNKLSCVAHHYKNYYIPEIDKFTNSDNTKNEDFADIAGLQLAYKAYKKWVHYHGKEIKLPKLDYTPKQLFWISSAVRYCSKGSTEAINKTVTHSYQSLKRFRVLGALQNSKDFAKDFYCLSNSPMNPREKCELW